MNHECTKAMGDKVYRCKADSNGRLWEGILGRFTFKAPYCLLCGYVGKEWSGRDLADGALYPNACSPEDEGMEWFFSEKELKKYMEENDG